MSKIRSGMIMAAGFLLAAVAGAALLLSPKPLPQGIGAEDVTVPDPRDKPLAVRIWYPADDAKRLPLIVISHGTGGSNTGHEDSALALVQAGFVVAAVTHTGDNYRDDSYVGKGLQLSERPRHVSRVIDYMLERWPQRRRIDADRIGMFGFSAGGFTALVVAGGAPDLSRGPERCRNRPEAWDCRYLKEHGVDLARQSGKRPPVRWGHDVRVRAAVIAAPAVGYSFEPDGLAGAAIPVQLWEAQHDTIVEESPAIVRRLMPAAEHHLVVGAGHFAFLMPCDWTIRVIIAAARLTGTPDICADPDGFDRAAFHRRFNREMAAFFGRALR